MPSITLNMPLTLSYLPRKLLQRVATRNVKKKNICTQKDYYDYRRYPFRYAFPMRRVFPVPILDQVICRMHLIVSATADVKWYRRARDDLPNGVRMMLPPIFYRLLPMLLIITTKITTTTAPLQHRPQYHHHHHPRETMRVFFRQIRSCFVP